MWQIIFSSKIFEETFIQFMKTTKTTNVNIVANNFLLQVIWKNTFTHFMKAIKIINVNLVTNHFSMHKIWRNTLIQFIKVTKITNVTCEKLFSRGDGLKKHIDGVHKGHKNATNYKSTFDLSWTIACLSTKFILTRQLH